MEHQSLEQFLRTAAEVPMSTDRRRRTVAENPLFRLNPVRSSFYYPEALAVAALIGGAWVYALYSLVH